MTWREQTIARILLILARMLADDSEIRDALKQLATQVNIAPKLGAVA